ncbi:MAG: Hemocyanin, ig-like domain [Bacteroidota bacterium]|nr:Hemocyanin, ig-like domain [Bacteroidota bacterium]
MATKTLEQIKGEYFSLFAESTSLQRKVFFENKLVRPLEISRPIKKDGVSHAIDTFSAFIPAHMRRANEVANMFFAIADGTPDVHEALDKVREHYESLKGKENPDLLYHALMMFMVHDEKGKLIPVPSVFYREAEKIAPSNQHLQVRNLMLAGLTLPTEQEKEDQLAWFREDPLLNEHHGYWHVVYPFVGIKGHFKERQGELFMFMHRQMLARYDAERLAAGLPRVIALDDLSKPLPVGYNPSNGFQTHYVERPAGKPGGDFSPDVTPQTLLGTRGLIQKAVSSGSYVENGKNVQLNNEVIGSFIEAENMSQNDRPLGNYHNLGHCVLAAADYVAQQNYGVMIDTTVAIRDSIFWRWHKHIDEQLENWESRQPVRDFIDAPKALLRKGWKDNTPFSTDVILSRTDDLKELLAKYPDLNDVADKLFGGDNWNKDFTSVSGQASIDGVNYPFTTTTQLNTRDIKRTLKLKMDDAIKPVDITMLDHDSFHYFFRVENQLPLPKKLTIRVFIVPADQVESRTAYIELDKFIVALNPNEKKVIARQDMESAIIRKPVITRAELDNYTLDWDKQEKLANAASPADMATAYCYCGWPYHLMLPAGNATGASYYLATIITDADFDDLRQQGQCSSFSFCGSRDKYPDRREMGYPFDKAFANGVVKTLTALDTVAYQPITNKKDAGNV